MSSVSRSAAAPTATSMDMGTMIMDETVSTVRSAVPTGAPAAGASGATFEALEEALPPCAISCVSQYTSAEAACAAATTIQTCGAAACTGPDLTRFEAFLEAVAPLCEGAAAGSAQGTASAGAPRTAGNAATGTASAAVKTNGTKAAGNSAAATGTATKAATTAAKNSGASMMNVFGLFASAAALLVL
ncbi:hypothetical protein HDU78_006514 [Chytriomyces hyalinus]|nr:hypothetical protein HDU78_006514 [Chytriomyces hyalinus]KAJ3259467.1 hypothetical protein HDU77_001867 [Chytriomyces hyalinus]